MFFKGSFISVEGGDLHALSLYSSLAHFACLREYSSDPDCKHFAMVLPFPYPFTVSAYKRSEFLDGLAVIMMKEAAWISNMAALAYLPPKAKSVCVHLH